MITVPTLWFFLTMRNASQALQFVLSLLWVRWAPILYWVTSLGAVGRVSAL